MTPFSRMRQLMPGVKEDLVVKYKVHANIYRIKGLILSYAIRIRVCNVYVKCITYLTVNDRS